MALNLFKLKSILLLNVSLIPAINCLNVISCSSTNEFQEAKNFSEYIYKSLNEDLKNGFVFYTEEQIDERLNNLIKDYPSNNILLVNENIIMNKDYYYVDLVHKEYFSMFESYFQLEFYGYDYSSQNFRNVLGSNKQILNYRFKEEELVEKDQIQSQTGESLEIDIKDMQKYTNIQISLDFTNEFSDSVKIDNKFKVQVENNKLIVKDTTNLFIEEQKIYLRANDIENPSIIYGDKLILKNERSQKHISIEEKIFSSYPPDSWINFQINEHESLKNLKVEKISEGGEYYYDPQTGILKIKFVKEYLKDKASIILTDESYIFNTLILDFYIVNLDMEPNMIDYWKPRDNDNQIHKNAVTTIELSTVKMNDEKIFGIMLEFNKVNNMKFNFKCQNEICQDKKIKYKFVINNEWPNGWFLYIAAEDQKLFEVGETLTINTSLENHYYKETNFNIEFVD